jgi:hypothetical protein
MTATYFCRECGLSLTPHVEVRGNRYYISYHCADHPAADQDGRDLPREIDGD